MREHVDDDSMYRAGGVNGFKVASPYENGEKQAKTEEEQEEFIDFLHQQPPGYLYIRHQYFIDFTRYKNHNYVNHSLFRRTLF